MAITPAEFLQLLTDTSDLAEIAEELVIKGAPLAFDHQPGLWDEVRTKLATSLGCDLEGIYVIGSAKMGYSLAPRKYGQPFGAHSDVDVVVIDAALYDAMWLSILRWHYRRRHSLPPPDRAWDEERRKGLYWGYLEPSRFNYRGLSRSRQLNAARAVSTAWFGAFQSLGLIPALADRRLTGRLYRSMSHAVLYHDHGLRLLRQAVL